MTNECDVVMIDNDDRHRLSRLFARISLSTSGYVRVAEPASLANRPSHPGSSKVVYPTHKQDRTAPVYPPGFAFGILLTKIAVSWAGL